MASLALSSGGIRRGSLRLASVLAAAGLVVSPPAAAGGDPNPHDGVSSVSQYVEDIPTAEGPVAAGVRARGSTPSASPPPPAPLPARVDRALERSGGRDARALKELATEPALGAPPRSLPRSLPPGEALDEPSAASAVTSATTGGGTAVTVALALMALVTLAAVALAVRRARR